MPRKKAAKSAKPARKRARRTMSAAVATAKKVSNWNFRVEPKIEWLIDAAAAAVGRTRTDFVLQSARAQAEHVLLSRVYFPLGDADWKALNAALDSPPPANEALRAAFRATPLWERQ